MLGQHNASNNWADNRSDAAYAESPSNAGRAYERWIDRRRQYVRSGLSADDPDPGEKRAAHDRKNGMGNAEERDKNGSEKICQR